MVGRVRSDRVMRLPRPPRIHGVKGRLPKHGPEFRSTKQETWPEPAITTATDTGNYGKAEAQSWDRVRPRLTHRSAWLDHEGEPPLVEGTLIRLKVEHLSKERDAPPVWLWSSKTGAAPVDVGRCWRAFLRRCDLEHAFRFAKQTLGWTTPKHRTPEAADHWTWILIVAIPNSDLPGRSPRTSAAVGGTHRLRPPHPGPDPGPPRVQEHTRSSRLPAPSSQTHRHRPRTATRRQETITAYPATTSARPSNAPRPSRPSASLEDSGR